MIPPSGWRVVDGTRLRKTFLFPDFQTALAFANRIGETPLELHLAWGQVDVTISADGGVAARIDDAYFAIS